MVLQNLDIYSINIHISKLTLYRDNHTALYKFIALETCVLMDRLFAIRINFIYSKIPIINSRASFWSKGLFTNFFLGGGGGLIYGQIFAFCKHYFFVQVVVIF